MAKKKGLGRGLDALLGAPGGDSDPQAETLREIAVDLIRPNPFQPRQHFSQERLEELAGSIRAQGVIQPVVVRRRSGEYELISGERRWRAAGLVGLATIPAVVREIDDHQSAAIALIENLQREDLDPIEQARAIAQLSERFSLTHQQIAQVLGLSRPAVSNALRLLKLAEPVQAYLAEGALEAGHARALGGLPLAKQAEVAEKIIAQGLNVRQVEALVNQVLAQSSERAQTKKQPDPDIERLARQLTDDLGVDVSISTNRKGKGQMKIGFASNEQLASLLQRLGVK